MLSIFKMTVFLRGYYLMLNGLVFRSISTGSSEMLMADAVSKLAAKTPGKEAVAMEAFAKALRTVSLIFGDVFFQI